MKYKKFRRAPKKKITLNFIIKQIYKAHTNEIKNGIQYGYKVTPEIYNEFLTLKPGVTLQG